ncbi:chitin-binding type-2 domain-containing protein [Trichonephila clavata]|uniref:Chitin-binding type-2 domain-containing protein n=1 Tax=Trichonephila clavata TaxID=2740835 RepID=A0A8X6FMV8_TRICU|nr:chitin-binding type-2 domain-containing protein [Trichonephila clavata]
MESAGEWDQNASDHPEEIRISKRSVDEFEAETHSETHDEGRTSTELTQSWSSANLSLLKSVLGIDSSDITGEKKEEHAHSGNHENWDSTSPPEHLEGYEPQHFFEKDFVYPDDHVTGEVPEKPVEPEPVHGEHSVTTPDIPDSGSVSDPFQTSGEESQSSQFPEEDSLEYSDLVINEPLRGIPGVHFPDYQEIPWTSFDCSDKKYHPGFYADTETGCQVFHVCYDFKKASFLCPIGTIFNQAVLTCDFWYNSNCSTSPQYYYVNEGIGQVHYKNKEVHNFDEYGNQEESHVVDDEVIHNNRDSISRHPLPGSRHPTPGSRYPTPGSRHPTPGSRHPTPGSRYPTPRPKHTTHKPWHPTPETKHTTQRPWHPTPGSKHTTQKPWHPTPGSKHTTHEPWHPTPEKVYPTPKHTTPEPWHTTRRSWHTTPRSRHTTPRSWHSTSRPWHSTSRPWHSTPRTWLPTARPGHSTARPWHPTPDTKHPTPGSRHPTPGSKRPPTEKRVFKFLLSPLAYLKLFFKFFPIRAKVSVYPVNGKTKVEAVTSIGGAKQSVSVLSGSGNATVFAEASIGGRKQRPAGGGYVSAAELTNPEAKRTGKDIDPSVHHDIDDAFEIVRRVLDHVGRLVSGKSYTEGSEGYASNSQVVSSGSHRRRYPYCRCRNYSYSNDRHPGRYPERHPGRHPERYPERHPERYPERHPGRYPERHPGHYPNRCRCRGSGLNPRFIVTPIF